MQSNYLVPSIIKLFSQVEYYKGYINHLEHDINHYSKNLIEQLNNAKFFEKKDQILIKGSRLAISDLTGETDNGWEINFPLPTDGYIVTSDDYYEKNQDLIQVVSSTLFSQSYEALESYFKDILALYFENNNEIAFETIGKINCFRKNKKIDWNRTVRKLKTGSNNSELLNIFQILSPEFSHSEINNNKNLNLAKWYKVISISRHAIIHSNSIISRDLFNGLDLEERNILSYFFDIESKIEGYRRILLSSKKGSELLEFICEYGFLIFKCLSRKNNLDWKILANMNKQEA